MPRAWQILAVVVVIIGALTGISPGVRQKMPNFILIRNLNF